uniref:Uncharacterized protein n=1 Tax=Rangifer tarandus platyrhynchus TaxID=3082113 RepID=A0ACB0DPT2_RANTA|nr:unnamed protein product [Rangifer tarandus platyrhynchus]
MRNLLLRQAKGFPRLVWLVDAQNAAASTQDGCSVSNSRSSQGAGTAPSRLTPQEIWTGVLLLCKQQEALLGLGVPDVRRPTAPHLPVTALRHLAPT